MFQAFTRAASKFFSRGEASGFSVTLGELPDEFPSLAFHLRFSVPTEGDSDNLCSVDQGRYLYVADLGWQSMGILDAGTGRMLWSPGDDQRVHGLHQGRVFFANRQGLVVHNLASGLSEQTFEGYTGLSPVSAPGLLYVLDSEKHLTCLDMASLQVAWRDPNPWPSLIPRPNCFSSCGKYFISKTARNAAEIWEIRKARCVFRGELGRGEITKVRAHPAEPVFVISSMGGLLWILDVRTPGKAFAQVLASESRGCSFTEDGRYLVVVNSDQHELLWVMDYPRRSLFQPLTLDGDPWGVAAWGSNQIAVAHSQRIDFYEFTPVEGTTRNQTPL